MNYGLALSPKVERHLLALEVASEGDADDDDDGAGGTLGLALALVVEEVYEESGQ